MSASRISSSLDIKQNNAFLLYVGLFGVLAPFILTGATKYSLVSLYIYIERERANAHLLVGIGGLLFQDTFLRRKNCSGYLARKLHIH